MPPKKSKVQLKEGEEASQQVGRTMEGARHDTQELSDLIRMAMREELNVVVDKLNNLTKEISACTRKIGEVEETMSDLDSRVTK